MGRFWRAPFHRQQPYVLQGGAAHAHARKAESGGSARVGSGRAGCRVGWSRVRAAYVRVRHEDVHAVLRVLLVLALGLEHEPLEDVVVPRDDAVCVWDGACVRACRDDGAASDRSATNETTSGEMKRLIPYFELSTRAVVLEALRASYLV